MMAEGSKPAFLLHCCCAPCSTHPIRMLQQTYAVTAFFYNPNIHPQDEYEKRQEEMEALARRWDVPLILGPYEIDDWFQAVKGYEEEPEGGARCAICYRMRMEKTARTAKDRGMGLFGTTLSVSPLKKVSLIHDIGKDIEAALGVIYHEADFKKQDGFKISCRLSREEGLYRQNYCGCVFSRRK